MTVYLDTSVVIPTLFEESASEDVDAFLRANHEERLISDFACAEVSSAVSRLVRVGFLEVDDATARLTDFDTWRVTETSMPATSSVDVRLAEMFVRRFALMLRAPDALHVAICQRLDATLVTLDRRLAEAAGALGLRVLVPRR